jgi:competence protein ComEA
VNRTGWLAAIGLALLGAGLVARWRWPSSESVLACDASEVRWIDAGGVSVATCAPGTPRGELPAGGAQVLGLKFDLNAVSEAELARVEGIGPKLAHALVQGREARNGFQSWEEVRGVPGVGPVKLGRLQEVSELRR